MEAAAPASYAAALSPAGLVLAGAFSRRTRSTDRRDGAAGQPRRVHPHHRPHSIGSSPQARSAALSSSVTLRALHSYSIGSKFIAGALCGVSAQTAVYAALIPIDAVGGQVGGHTTKRTVH